MARSGGDTGGPNGDGPRPASPSRPASATTAAVASRRPTPRDPAEGPPSRGRGPQRQRPVARRGHRRRRPGSRRGLAEREAGARRRGSVPRRRHAPQAGRRGHRGRRRVGPGQDLQGQGGRHAERIAHKHGVSMMTLWWANKLKSKDDLHQRPGPAHPAGQRPGRRGHRVRPSRAWPRSTRSRREIVETNGLEDPNSSSARSRPAGRQGRPIPTPKPTKKPARPSRTAGQAGGAGRLGSRPRVRRRQLRWPLGRPLSQYYHYGHYGLDIDGSTGDPIVAAAGGR